MSNGVYAAGSGNTVTFTIVPGGSLERTTSTAAAGLMSNGICQLVLDGSLITDTATGTELLNGGAALDVSFPSAEVAGGSSTYFHDLFGDANGDGTVNLTDYRSFVHSYLTSSGSANYDIAFDFNSDETVNLIDYRQFVSDDLKQFTY